MVAAQLLACPFCRELYGDDERTICPHCDVNLKPLYDLPPSYEVREAEAAVWERTAPEDRRLPITHLGHGRGPLLLLAVLGFGLCFLPWIEVSRPEYLTLSAFQLARTKGFWFSGSLVGWFVAIPLLLSRRTLNQLRSARVAMAMFAALPIGQVLMLALNAPSSERIPLAYTWGWAFYASGAVGALALGLAFVLGRALPGDSALLGPDAPATAATSAGQTLH